MAGRASLAFLGREDLALSVDPEITYFIEKYKGSSQFASRVDKVQFENGAINFGQEQIVYLPKSGDLMTGMYLKIFPPFQAGSYVLDSVGTLMINYIELYIGNECIERIYGEYIEMKMDLEIPTGKQPSLQGLVGKTPPTSRSPVIQVAPSYTIPLPFSTIKKGLPICLIKDPIFFRISFAPSVLFTTSQVSYDGPVTSYLHVEYTYLGDSEISHLKSKPPTYLIEQVQRQAFYAPSGMTYVQCLLEFVNPVKELFFVIQNDSARGYDYTLTAPASVTQNSPVFGTGDQLTQLTLLFNSTERISTDIGTPVFLSTIQSLEYHTRNPDRQFYSYSFSIDPEGDSPTGSVNLSMIKNQILQLNLNSGTTGREIRVYAVGYNFLKFENERASLAFQNAEVS